MTAPAQIDPPADHELFCPRCSYSLRGLTSDNCPECGLKVDRTGAGVSRIPWEHRRRIGRLRAYWRTVHMPRSALADEMMRPVRYRDARLFQLITVLIASAPLVVVSAWPLPSDLYGMATAGIGSAPIPSRYAIDIVVPLLTALSMKLMFPLAIVLFLLAVTGVASYFFHPPHLTVVQQNRAIALSYYACSPLLLLAAPGLLALTGLILARLDVHVPKGWDSLLATACIAVASTPIGGVVVAWYGYARLLRRATVCSPARVMMLMVTLPLAWVLLAAVVLLGLPWIAGFTALVAWSFG